MLYLRVDCFRQNSSVGCYVIDHLLQGGPLDLENKNKKKMTDAMLSCVTRFSSLHHLKLAHKNKKPVSFDEKLIKNLRQILEINRDVFLEHLRPDFCETQISISKSRLSSHSQTLDNVRNLDWF